MKGMDPRLRGDDVVATSMIFADTSVDEKFSESAHHLHVIPAKAWIHIFDFMRLNQKCNRFVSRPRNAWKGRKPELPTLPNFVLKPIPYLGVRK
jgi:hypothetical protein